MSHPINSFFFICETTRSEPRLGIELILLGENLFMPLTNVKARSIFSTILPASISTISGFIN